MVLYNYNTVDAVQPAEVEQCVVGSYVIPKRTSVCFRSLENGDGTYGSNRSRLADNLTRGL